MKTFGKIFSLFRSRPACVALLLYQVFFFNIVLPGHTRGEITLDGKHTADPSPCCCCCGGGANPENAKNDSKHPPSQKDRENCALCNFAARVMPTPIFCVRLPEMGLLEAVRLPVLREPVSLLAISTYRGRAPPVVV